MEVVDLLNKKSIEYRLSGRDFLVHCLNPEHDDSNPSMRIDQITGVFNCFSCGFKGSVFNFYGEKPNLLQQQREKLKQGIHRKMAETRGLQLPTDAIPYQGSWRGISNKTYQKFGAFESASDDFISRINFPITTADGKIVAFIGRHTAEGTPRYKVSPRKAKVPLFPKVDPIQGSVILVEGIFDMLNLQDKGLSNAIACFGTNACDLSKLKLLKMQGISKVYIMFDNDEAGQKAAEELKELAFSADLDASIIRLKGVSDPGEMDEKYIQALKRKLYDEP